MPINKISVVPNTVSQHGLVPAVGSTCARVNTKVLSHGQEFFTENTYCMKLV